MRPAVVITVVFLLTAHSVKLNHDIAHLQEQVQELTIEYTKEH